MSTSSPAILELRVEAADRLQRVAPEGHVAAGDVLGDRRRESRTWVGPPGAWATALSTMPASAGTRLGPPTPAWSVDAEGVREVTEPVRGRARRRRR